MSGFSGGGFFSAYASLALSDTIAGFGMWGGGPYGSDVYRVNYFNETIKFMAQRGIDLAKTNEEIGVIPDLQNL